MSTFHLEPLLRAAERRAIVSVLRSHPEWTLEHVASLLEHEGDLLHARGEEEGVRRARLHLGDLGVHVGGGLVHELHRAHRAARLLQ
jgi:hypothetical protein